MAQIFNITERRSQDDSIQGVDYIYAYDTGHGSDVSQTSPPKDFTITIHDTSSYLVPNQSTLDLNFKTQLNQNNAGWVDAPGANPSVIMGDISQIFEHISLSIGGVVVEQMTSHAGIVKQVEHLVDMSKEYRDSVGTLMQMGEDRWYDNDDAGARTGVSTPTSGDPLPVVLTTEGYDKDVVGSLLHKCSLIQSNSREINLSIPLPLLFNTFKYYTKVLTGAPIECRFLIRDDAALFRNSVSADKGRIVWLKRGLTLKMCKVTPSLPYRTKLHDLREKDTMIHLDGYDSQVNVIDISTNPTDLVQEVVCKGATTIKYAMIFFKNKVRLAGSTKDVSPQILDHYNIQRLSISLNGEKWRQRDYEMQFPANIYASSSGVRKWQDPYTELMRHAGNMAAPVDNSYQGQCTLSYETFAKYPVFVFDLSRSESKVTPNSNSLTVQLTRAAGAGAYRMYVVTYSPKTVNVNMKSGNVSVSSSNF